MLVKGLCNSHCAMALLVTRMLGEWFPSLLHVPKAWPFPDAATGGGSASLNVQPWQPLPPARMSTVQDGVLSPHHCWAWAWQRSRLTGRPPFLPFRGGQGRVQGDSYLSLSALLLLLCPLQQQLGLVLEQYLQTLAHFKINWAAFKNADSCASLQKVWFNRSERTLGTCILTMLPWSHTCKNPAQWGNPLAYTASLHNMVSHCIIHSLFHPLIHSSVYVLNHSIIHSSTHM